MSDPYPQYQLRDEKGAPSGYAPLTAAGKLLTDDLPTIDHGTLTGLGDDDHPQYQRETEKGASNGYAPLDTIGVVPLVHLPSELVIASELTDHGAASDPHPVYQKETEKGSANGYASLDAGGFVPGDQLPASFFGWGSLSSGILTDSMDPIYTVPVGKVAQITFLSVKNTHASLTTEIELHILRGAVETDVGSVTLDYQEYVWYLDSGVEYWTLSAGDQILASSFYDGISAFIITGAEKDA